MVDPKSILIGAGVNFVFASNSISGSAGDFSCTYGPAMHSQFNIQIGIRKNYFLESNISFEKHWITFSNKEIERSHIFSQDIKMLKLEAGLAYRLTNSLTHYNFATLSGGVGLGYVVNKFIDGTNYGGITSSANSYFEEEVTVHLKQTLVPNIYLGISKDLKLTKKLILSFGYRFDLGLINYFSANQNYRFAMTDSFSTALITSKGTVHTATLLLKYCVVPKRKK